MRNKNNVINSCREPYIDITTIKYKLLALRVTTSILPVTSFQTAVDDWLPEIIKFTMTQLNRSPRSLITTLTRSDPSLRLVNVLSRNNRPQTANCCEQLIRRPKRGLEQLIFARWKDAPLFQGRPNTHRPLFGRSLSWLSIQIPIPFFSLTWNGPWPWLLA